MKKSTRFKSVVRVAEAREKQAASALGEAQAELESRVARLEELQHYQQDYQIRFNESAGHGLAAFQIRDFKHFLANLKLAIEQQETIVSLAQRVVEERKQAWFSKRGMLKSYDNVLDRYYSEELTVENKREQNETDERAQLLFIHKKRGI